jgi:hypothetical protein
MVLCASLESGHSRFLPGSDRRDSNRHPDSGYGLGCRRCAFDRLGFVDTRFGASSDWLEAKMMYLKSAVSTLTARRDYLDRNYRVGRT